jgi:hypothetical protein
MMQELKSRGNCFQLKKTCKDNERKIRLICSTLFGILKTTWRMLDDLLAGLAVGIVDGAKLCIGGR